MTQYRAAELKVGSMVMLPKYFIAQEVESILEHSAQGHIIFQFRHNKYLFHSDDCVLAEL